MEHTYLEGSDKVTEVEITLVVRFACGAALALGLILLPVLRGAQDHSLYCFKRHHLLEKVSATDLQGKP